MQPQTEQKIILIVRDTRLDELVARHNTVAQTKFYIEHLGADFTDYQIEDQHYKTSVLTAERSLRKIGRVQKLHRAFLPNFIFGDQDIIVTLGQDGLVANTIKYLRHQPVVGVNPDPCRWDGVLLPFKVEDLNKIVPEVIAQKRRAKQITMAKAELCDGQALYAVNDFFVGARTHVSAKYRIRVGKQQEDHSSSGIIISTGLGSTGWLKSVVTGAVGIANHVIDTLPNGDIQSAFAWDADYLLYSVREPFPSHTTATSLIFGRIDNSTPLLVESQMAENGVIFSDGMVDDFLSFNAGLYATITIAANYGRLVV